MSKLTVNCVKCRFSLEYFGKYLCEHPIVKEFELDSRRIFPPAISRVCGRFAPEVEK